MTGSRGVQPATGAHAGISVPAGLAAAPRRGTAQPASPSGSSKGDEAESDILNSLPFAIAVIDANGTIEFVNAAWRRTAETGGVPPEVDAFVGMNYVEVCERAARGGLQQAATAASGIKSVLSRQVDKFSSVYHTSHADQERCGEMQVRSRTGGGAVITHTDATARVRAERQLTERTQELMHLSRALTAGTLSGALTHELNQPLTAILANAQAALRMLESPIPDGTIIRESVRDTIRAVQRASEIVKRTRNLLTHSTPRREEIDINDVVLEATKLLSNEALLRGVRLTVLRALDLPLVIGDPIQLQQSVINLVLNGFDAMADMSQAERHVLVHTNRSGLHNVEIVIEDRGTGIEPAQMERIFEPFHTTKRNGMGMGLYITREIIRIHGGRISFRRNPERGTRVRIALPSAEKAERGQSGASMP